MLASGTDRLEIRELRPEDVADLHACISDPQVTRFFPWGPNDSESQTREFVERAVRAAAARPRENYMFGVVIRARGLVGCCFLDRRREREFEVGYYLRRDHWNRGLATEALGVVVPFAFRELEAHRVYARVDPENPASARVLEHVGFRPEGRLRRDSFIKGQWRDSLLYALLEDE